MDLDDLFPKDPTLNPAERAQARLAEIQAAQASGKSWEQLLALKTEMYEKAQRRRHPNFPIYIEQRNITRAIEEVTASMRHVLSIPEGPPELVAAESDFENLFANIPDKDATLKALLIFTARMVSPSTLAYWLDSRKQMGEAILAVPVPAEPGNQGSREQFP